MDQENVDRRFDLASRAYGELGVDVEKALDKLENVHVSLHCWQGDDVSGFETPDAKLSGGGIQATGNYPGKARTLQELQQDYEKAFSLVPGRHRANIHAIYGDFQGERVDRDEIETAHFQAWIDWARELGIGLDFNSTLFSHPLADDGFTLSSKDPRVREFWIEHVQRCRNISEDIGRQVGSPCIHNLWIPDGSKDNPVDRAGHRNILLDSLDKIFETRHDHRFMKDSVEGKLFGIGSEAFVVGSNDFYLGYAISRGVMLTMDMGHYHPTESVADKVSAVLPFMKELLIHVSRGLRWDSDHVVIVNDDLVALAQEIVRSGRLNDVHLALDYFDASINRIGAWVVGMRSTLKAILFALLEPWKMLREYEEAGQDFQRLALLEELKSMPFGDVWNGYCKRMGVPTGLDYMHDIERYEKEVLSKRNGA